MRPAARPLEEYEKRIGYRFQNKELLETALTHSSFANEHKCKSYERLEFLGDSVLGYKAHMGAGSITSNLRSDKGNITVHGPEIRTGMRKFGAMIGDFAEIGCGSVLNPGTVIGRETIVYPLSSVRGCVAEKSIYKHAGEIAARIEKE